MQTPARYVPGASRCEPSLRHMLAMNKLRSMLRWSLSHNIPAIVVISGYVAMAFALSHIFEFPLSLHIYNYVLLLTLGAVAVVYVTTISVTTVWVHRSPRPITFLLPRLVSVHRVPQ